MYPLDQFIGLVPASSPGDCGQRDVRREDQVLRAPALAYAPLVRVCPVVQFILDLSENPGGVWPAAEQLVLVLGLQDAVAIPRISRVRILLAPREAGFSPTVRAIPERRDARPQDVDRQGQHQLFESVRPQARQVFAHVLFVHVV